MRLFKTLGLAAIAALAAMAFIASTASADTVCESPEGHANECPPEKRVGEGKFIEGLTEKAILLPSVGGNVECHSNVLGKIGKNEGAHIGLEGLIESLTFTNCVGECLTAKSENTPYKILIDALKLHAVVEAEPEKPKPAALLEGCNTPFGKVSCLYEIEGNSILLDIEGDKLIAKEEKLLEVVTANHSILCPSKAFWDGTYLTTLDGNNTAVYITGLP